MKDENIVSAALVASHEVNKLMEKRKVEGKPHLPIYLVGSNALRTMLEEITGVECFGTGPDVISDYTDVIFFLIYVGKIKTKRLITELEDKSGFTVEAFGMLQISGKIKYINSKNALF